ncbi:uncharacterized protein FIBRA_07449 [Fibroporia radiculosa]|uniref:Uncharacterized protein n=1 Tax=Fibroporia radiculosa TaxID=599839 RepID=J4H4M3_9APHY|nr:uncharacterized protein FIBRA_07449 [Fibroporia radiculosa]CCM05239.1 predicted protein [Fibroporia radiculosa]
MLLAGLAALYDAMHSSSESPRPVNTDPMPSLAMNRSITERSSTSRALPVQQLSDKAVQRMLHIQHLEQQQRLEDLEAIEMTNEQLEILQKPFESVKVEFADLDGLSWSTPAAKHILAKWYKRKVLEMRQETDPFGNLDSVPYTLSRALSDDKDEHTIRATRSPRFPPCPPLVAPPLTLPAGLQEHLEAASSGDLTLSSVSNLKRPSGKSSSSSRTPAHRVFSLPPKAPPALMRTATARPGDRMEQNFQLPAASGNVLPPKVFSLPPTSNLPAMEHIASVQSVYRPTMEPGPSTSPPYGRPETSGEFDLAMPAVEGKPNIDSHDESSKPPSPSTSSIKTVTVPTVHALSNVSDNKQGSSWPAPLSPAFSPPLRQDTCAMSVSDSELPPPMTRSTTVCSEQSTLATPPASLPSSNVTHERKVIEAPVLDLTREHSVVQGLHNISTEGGFDCSLKPRLIPLSRNLHQADDS